MPEAFKFEDAEGPGLFSSVPYVSWVPKYRDNIRLDGQFTVAELRSIANQVEAKLKKLQDSNS